MLFHLEVFTEYFDELDDETTLKEFKEFLAEELAKINPVEVENNA